MDLDNAIEIALTFIAVIVATFAVISFTSIELFSSPLTVSVLVLLIAFSAHFGLSRTDDKTLVYTGYVILCLYTISVLWYLTEAFSISPIIQTTALLLISATILTGVYFIRSDYEALTKRNMLVIIGILFVLSATLVATDYLTDDPTDEIIPKDNVTVAEDRNAVIAQIQAQNPSILPKTYDSKSYTSCVSTELVRRDDPRENIRVPRNLGFETISDDPVWDERSKDFKIDVSQFKDSIELSEIEVTRTERCPTELDNKTIAVFPE